MKKLIALLLVAVMCLSFVACGGSGSAKKEIVGEWKCPESGYSITFNEDGTGIDPDDGDLTWKYDSELSCYSAHIGSYGMTLSVSIKTTEDGLRYINIAGEKYYHSDDYDKGFEIEIAEEKEYINESIIETKTKVEFGKTYDYKEGISVKFTDLTIEDEKLYLHAQFTNSKSNNSYIDPIRFSTYLVKRAAGYNDDPNPLGMAQTIPASESLDLTIEIRNSFGENYLPNNKNMTYYYVYFTMNGVEYYIDNLVEYFK